MTQKEDFINQPSRFKILGDLLSELLKVVLISLIIIIPVRYFVLQPFFVKGASMEPNFYDHEYLVIDEISYRFKEPQRGEIVVFRYPKDPRQYFIKRIVGLPNEALEIKENSIYINGVKIDESGYLPEETTTFGNLFVKLGSDQYFLMGDNRNFSLDSRSFGPVPRQFIVGRAWFRGWPFDKFTVFQAPMYNF